MFVQVYVNHVIGEQIMNIKKWEVRRNVNYCGHRQSNGKRKQLTLL